MKTSENQGPQVSAPALTVEQRLNVVVNHAFDGWHHVYNRKPSGDGVLFYVYAALGTWDFNQLTRLVVACHVVRVRAEIAQGGPGMVKIYLNPREDMPSSWPKHHPDGDDLIAMTSKLMAEIGGAA